MDMKKKSKIPKCGSLPDLTNRKIVVGAKQLKKAVRAGSVRYVYLAENADPAVTEPLGGPVPAKSDPDHLGAQYGRAWPLLRYRGGRGSSRCHQSLILPEIFRRIYTRPRGENKRKEKIDAYF